MIGLLFLLVVGWQFYIGYARGIVLQGYYFVASVFSVVIASYFYQGLADTLTLWIPFINPAPDAKVVFLTEVNLFERDLVFYAGTAFLISYIASYSLFRLLGIFLHLIDLDRFDDTIFNHVSGLLSVLTTLLWFSMVVTIFATVPVTAVQEFLSNHWVTRLLITAPLFSDLWCYFWIGKML